MTPPMPPGARPQQPKFTIKDTTELKCPCGNRTFREGFLIRLASRLITLEAKDTIVHVPIVTCNKCGEPFEQMLPEELKSKPILVS